MIDGSKNASIRAIKGMFIIESLSGYRMMFSDPDSFHCFLPLDVDARLLGEEIRRALESSRTMTIEEAQEYRISDARWSQWVSTMLAHTKISNEQKLFQKMALCNVREHDGLIVFSPNIKRRGSAWEGRGEAHKLSLTSSSDSLTLGQFAIEAIKKCVPAVLA
ncbi:contact-dependent growth inhibition system immunity protein [Marinobacter xiaoshiensis]|uniref:contact-dependent growth inhibition system immunity protein n=1 Tax=Marinobacter xiaoshiensis TaxID=3073652 RepID=UPI00338DA7D7